MTRHQLTTSQLTDSSPETGKGQVNSVNNGIIPPAHSPIRPRTFGDTKRRNGAGMRACACRQPTSHRFASLFLAHFDKHQVSCQVSLSFR